MLRIFRVMGVFGMRRKRIRTVAVCLFVWLCCSLVLNVVDGQITHPDEGKIISLVYFLPCCYVFVLLKKYINFALFYLYWMTWKIWRYLFELLFVTMIISSVWNFFHHFLLVETCWNQCITCGTWLQTMHFGYILNSPQWRLEWKSFEFGAFFWRYLLHWIDFFWSCVKI